MTTYSIDLIEPITVEQLLALPAELLANIRGFYASGIGNVHIEQGTPTYAQPGCERPAPRYVVTVERQHINADGTHVTHRGVLVGPDGVLPLKYDTLKAALNALQAATAKPVAEMEVAA